MACSMVNRLTDASWANWMSVLKNYVRSELRQRRAMPEAGRRRRRSHFRAALSRRCLGNCRLTEL
jgi:hypothetical protein